MSLNLSLEKLGQVRDGLLVLLSTLYGAGYLAWALFAWIHELGPLPAVDAQYFMAGFPPLLLFLGTFFLARYATSFYAQAWPNWVVRQPKRRRLVLFAAAGAVLLSTLVHSIVRDNDWDLIAILPIALLVPGVISRKPNPYLASTVIYPVTLTAGLIAGLYYVAWFFPKMPQELGGARPLCALLDLDADALSRHTLEELNQWKPLAAQSGIIRSQEVRVLFAGSDTLMINACGWRVTRHCMVELRRDAVAAISWCDARSPSTWWSFWDVGKI